MNVIVNMPLLPEHRAQLCAVSEQVAVRFPEDRESMRAAVGTAEVIFGGFDPSLLPAARRLRWVQVPAAGVDGILTPEFVASAVTLVSAKGNTWQTTRWRCCSR
jgi:phosphoglycerate dehydrogenase-like enzyme